jgi:2-methylisocitrate lyase-like PEP mutase family enzyme
VSSQQAPQQSMTEPTDLESRCDRLRSLHVPGTPLVLPNAWDVASARAVAAAGFPVVATTSMGVAASLGYEDHERAPGEEMLAAAARIATGVNVPVTVDAEAGYAMEPTDLVASLKERERPAATSRTPTTPPASCATRSSRPTGCARFAERRPTRGTDS